MNRTLLCIAFHFPPIATSSGMQRSLKFVRYLRDDGWRPVVLTAKPKAYRRCNDSQLAEIPEDVPVYRAFALDSTRHLAIGHRHPGWLARPDPWITWWLGAVPTGLALIRRHRPSAIWSTFPITTASLVALTLHRLTGLPWIADLRDPMTMEGYPADPRRFRIARWIESRVVRHASRCVFTARHTLEMYQARYPDLADRAVLIPNGYDEANFPEPLAGREPAAERAGPLRIVHSGAMQPDGRNPRALFDALARLRARGVLGAHDFQLVLRACEFEEPYRALAEQAGVAELVAFEPHLPYEQAIEEMVAADALVIMQGTSFNHAVPAKLYEYLYARRPIIALLDRTGETANVLAEVGVEDVADIDDAADIADRLEAFINRLRAGEVRVPDAERIAPYSRRRQAQRLSAELAQVLDAAHEGLAAGAVPGPRRPG